MKRKTHIRHFRSEKVMCSVIHLKFQTTITTVTIMMCTFLCRHKAVNSEIQVKTK